MKKLTLLAITAFTLAGLGGQSLSVQAAPKANWHSAGNGIYYTYGYGCNIQDILNKFEDCFPGVSIPDFIFPGGNAPEVELPDCNVPEVDVPEVDRPETDAPEVDVPETDCPESGCPETDAPEVETPEDNLPEVDIPENNVPGTDTPDNDIPENNTPDTNVPDSDIPDNNNPDSNPGNGSTEENVPEDSAHAFIQRVVDLVNVERAKEGLSPLTVNKNVQAAAQVRAKECEQLFSHTRPNGSSFATALREQGVTYKSAGENIAWGQRSPEEVMNAWMNSPGHRKNIMNPNFTTIGVGYYENAKGTDYWCQLFTR